MSLQATVTVNPPSNGAGIYMASANFTVDLEGVIDKRAGDWGDAGSVTWNIVFTPAAGLRTRILSVAGDFLMWTPLPIVGGSSAGALFALASTGPGGSVNGSLIADNTFLYVQVASDGQPSRAAYDRDVHVGGLLEADNTLVVKVAVFLNNTGTALHCEPTMTIQYQFA
jgi:hypothetical protein